MKRSIVLILMVAIVVILSAVVGVFVLDVGNGLKETPNAPMKLDTNSVNDTVEIKMLNIGNVDEVRIYLENLSLDSYSGVTAEDPDTMPGSGDEYYVFDEAGDTLVLTESDGTSGTIDIIGVIDGDETVMQEYSYTL